MVKFSGSSNKTNFDYTFGGKLDVFGKLIVANDATIDGKLIVANDATINSDLKVDSKLDVEGRAYFSDDVGIGTDNPQEKLHIHEGDVVIGQDSGNNTKITNHIKFGRVDAPKAAIGFINDSGNGRGDIIFMSDNNGDASAFNDNNERVRITRMVESVSQPIIPRELLMFSVQ